MSLIENLVKLLKSNNKYVAENKLLKNKIIEDCLKLVVDLLKLLFSKDEIQETFFKKIHDIAIFDKDKFIKFISNKEFLPDSFTAFKNRIGLISENEFIKDKNDVVLNFPYKDCILEGGQNREDKGRNEIFWNETLAPDEIDRLLDDKVFTNFKKYTKNGEKDVLDITINDNLILKGNNLLILHSLRKKYDGKIKLIYIDPPYNTGNDSFKYNDKFNHSTWLTFMKNRLEVAKSLLKEDGVIFIQCDDNEQAYLKVLMDEVFINGYVQTICIKKATTAGFKSINLCPITTKEYLFIYSKNEVNKKELLNKLYVKADYIDDYDTYIPNINEKPENWEFINIKELFYQSIGVNKWTEARDKLGLNWKNNCEKFMSDFTEKNYESIISFKDLHKPSDKVKEIMNKSQIERDKIFIVERENKNPLYFKKGRSITFYKNKFRKVDGEYIISEVLSDIWTDIKWDGIAREGNVVLKNGKKPERLLKRIIELATKENDIVLDYHLGSGTTSAVAHKMNRRYIGIEQMDYIKDMTIPRMESVINGDQNGISEIINWQGGGEFIYAELKELNYFFVKQIDEIKNNKQAIELFKDILKNGFIDFRIDLSKENEIIEFLNTEKLPAIKEFLFSILDKNQMYLNYSEIEDITYKISDKEKEINKKFYTKVS